MNTHSQLIIMTIGIRSTLAGVILGHNRQLLLGSGSVAASGSSQATATALTYRNNNVTAADGTKGVILPTAAAGMIVVVYNSVATNGLPVYPATGAAINGGSANAAVTIEGKTLAIFVATSTTNWGAIYTANT